MNFARKQLEKYGWTDGKGLGKHENGISEALKPKLKRSVAGVGHDGAAEFNDHWWTTLYDKAAANVEVTEKNGKTKKIKTKDDKEFVISTSTWKMNRKPKDGEEEEQYADYFVRTAVLTNGASNVERLREEESDDEGEKKDVFKMTDEELFKTCEGRTAHKGARHGLKATGKLARIAQQEALLLSQSRFSGYSHAKKLKEQVEDINLNSDSDSTERKKKKKKRKRCNSNEKSENNKVECVLDVTEIPLTDESKVTDDDSVASLIKEVKVSRKSKKSKKKDFRDIESIPDEDEEVSEPKKKKKKKQIENMPEVVKTENITTSTDKNTNKLSKKKKKINIES
ncbi:hypothetical protein PYW07_011648 [Mythimna separata]|uniref:G patch domain-containing protein 4 n=1 Tax=Mythimna separata TaxID=271217 RepID=A0AAD7Y6L9_MYTSE|nr:hypothetical protein PYW07_011648 [Mythimna separata]